MPRLAYLSSAALIALACAPLPACGQQQDETERIVARCTDPPAGQVDSCLEEVRVRQETDPSPDLGKLFARLIKRQVEASNPPVELPPPPPDDNGIGNDEVTPPTSPDLGDGGDYESPPQMSPQDEAPPEEQANPAEAGDDEATGPPTPMPAPRAAPSDSRAAPQPAQGDGSDNAPHA